jgi:hypothetical protein
LAGPRIERHGLGEELYVFFTAVAEGWRGPFLLTRLVARHRGELQRALVQLPGSIPEHGEAQRFVASYQILNWLKAEDDFADSHAASRRTSE